MEVEHECSWAHLHFLAEVNEDSLFKIYATGS